MQGACRDTSVLLQLIVANLLKQKKKRISRSLHIGLHVLPRTHSPDFHTSQTVTCLVLYLKIINIFYQHIYILLKIVQGTQKKNIKNKVGQSVLKLLIQTTL